MRFNALIFLLFLIPVTNLQADWVRSHAAIMGTEIAVDIWHPVQAKAESAASSVMREMRRIDALMSVYKDDSEVSRINQLAAANAIKVSDELFGLLQQAEVFSRTTHGAFDITYASVGYLYDYRAGTKPDQAEIEEALPGIDYRYVELNEDDHSVRFLQQNVRIDLGGIAKGHAVDRAIAALKHQGIEHARITAGGDTRVLGTRLGRPWTVGVRNPRDSSKMVAVIPLLDESISTSGDYERYFDESGVRYHHIINPETGDSARELRSVSVIGPKAVFTDALSTSVFVMGIEAGLQMINNLENYEAIIVDKQGKLHYSAGLEQFQSAVEQKNRLTDRGAGLPERQNLLSVTRN